MTQPKGEITPITEQRLQEIIEPQKQSVLQLALRIEAVQLTDAAELEAAELLLVEVAKHKKIITAERQKFVDPLNKGLKVVRDFFNRAMEPLEAADAMLRERILQYHARKREALRKLQEAKDAKARREWEQACAAEALRLAALMEAEELGLTARDELQDTPAAYQLPELPPEPKPSSPAAAATWPKASRLETGTVAPRLLWKWEVIDLAKVPRAYLAINPKALTDAVQAGVREIEGVRIYQEESLQVRSR